MQARAQVTGNVVLTSDYRFRGISLSDDRPAAQLAVAYDLPGSGWYAGGMASSARLDEQNDAQLLGYAGFAKRVLPDLSWEAGVQYSRFTGQEAYPYAEAYVGVTYRQLVARLYYAPDYFNSGIPVLYAELNASHALTDHWYLLGHLGGLRRNGSAAVEATGRYRTDVRLGLGLAIGAYNAQLSWTDLRGPHGPLDAFGYPTNANAARNAWVISLTYAW